MNPLIPRNLRFFSRFILTPIISRTRITKPLRCYPQYQHPRVPLSTTAILKMPDTNNQDLLLGSLFDVKGKVALVTGGGKVLSLANSVQS